MKIFYLSQMSYQIIGDEEDVRKFYKIHLAPFVENKNIVFILFLLSRRKYFPDLSKSQILINRKIVSPYKGEDYFVREIKKYEVALGLYFDEGKNQEIPNDGLAFYLSVNPLNELKSMFLLQSKLNLKIQELVLSPEKKQEELRIGSVFKSCLNQSAEKFVKKLDVDTKDDDKIDSLKQLFSTHNIRLHLVIESANGYHVLIRRDADSMPVKAHKPLHDFVRANSEWIAFENAEALVIVPGTLQAGYLTKIVRWQ